MIAAATPGDGIAALNDSTTDAAIAELEARFAAERGIPLATALAYAERGWQVIPIKPGGKYPAGFGEWQLKATTDAATIEGWWNGTHKGYGVGIACGPESGVWVLDIDVSDGKTGEDTLAELERLHGPLPATYTVITGSGGRHLYFAYPTDGPPVRNDAAKRLGFGLDVRGGGGFVVAPPSIHPVTESAYVVDEGDWGDPEDVADAPAWLLKLVSEEPPKASASPASAPLPGLGDIGTSYTGDSAADRWSAAHDWAEILEPDGWTLERTIGAERQWTRPGKDGGVSATTNHGTADNLKVFTSSVPDLPEDQYTKLHYVAIRRFGGDMSAAAAWMKGELDGTPATRLREANLDGDVWDERPVFRLIRRAAHNRMVSPDAVLGCILTRVAALTPPTVRLPDVVGGRGTLDLCVAIIGPSGAGKSAAGHVAGDLLPILGPDPMELPLGSGEGLIDAYLGLVKEDGESKPVKRQVRRSVLFTLDEGRALAEMGGRKGATLMPAICSAAHGNRLGQANASADTFRNLPAGEYRFALIAGFQPEHATALIDDAAAGTPQRFLYVSALDPSIPDEAPAWPAAIDYTPPAHQAGPMGIDPVVAAEIRSRRRSAGRGAVTIPELDAHRDLNRLKVSGLLALLDGRTDITADDWRLSGILLDSSDRVRTTIVDAARNRARHAEDSRTASVLRRDEALEESAQGRAVSKMASAIGNHVHRHQRDGGCRRGCVSQSTASRDRAAAPIDAGIDEAERKEWIVVEGDVFRPGASRPG